MPEPKQTIPVTGADNSVTPVSPGSSFRIQWGLLLLLLAFFWFRLINNLRLEWTTDPQYGYGLLVPFLCLGLLVRRWQDARSAEVRGQRAEGGGQKSEIGDRRSEGRSQRSEGGGQWSAVLAFAALAFLYLPTRLIEAAVPEWRPIQWMLGIIAVGLTLCVIYLGKGRTGLRQLAFPICFFLVAIPWPTLVETPIIQTLTRISATVVTELLGWVGVPAVTHGNVIEVSTGLVGVDEACSGIRSFQSSLMISLFFGEFYRLNQPRRWLLVPLGFIFSMAFNVCRMSLLTLVAAKKGIAAISEYHDPAGFSITIICTLVLWGLAVLFKRSEAEGRRQKAEDGSQKAEGGDGKGQRENSTFVVQSSKSEIQTPVSRVQPAPLKLKSSTLGRLGASLLVWLVVVEGGVQVWYHTRESQLKPGLEWTLNFPGNNPTMKDLPIDSKTRYLLRFDEGKQAVWSEPDGTHWQAYYFNWFPGRVAGYLAKRHTPEICLASEGLRLISGPELNMMNIHGVELPIRCYQFQNEEGVIQVFHCRWEAGAGKDDYVAHDSARYNLIRTIWTGRGNQGQKVLEFIILGEDDPKRAKQALEQELSKLIVVKS